MTDFNPNLGSTTSDAQGHFDGNFTTILMCKMGLKIPTLWHCHENQRKVCKDYGFHLLSAYSYFKGQKKNFFWHWTSVVMNYLTRANAHQRGTRVNSWIRVLFALGWEGISVVSFQMRPPLGWQRMKECLGVGPGFWMRQHTWIFKHNFISSWPHCEEPISN